MIASSVAAAAAMTCPGSKAWFTHAKTQVTSVVKASCADVNAEIQARAAAEQGWVDPHNGGIYSILFANNGVGGIYSVRTQRTANPSHSVAGKKYVDKQVFTLYEMTFKLGYNACQISACSRDLWQLNESQGTSYKDYSTNYCDLRNLYCGSADGCTPVVHDFSSTQATVKASSGQPATQTAGQPASQGEFSACIVKKALIKSPAAMKCPGSGAIFGHAKTQVTATAKASCADVKAEIEARASAQKGWVDPHHGGIYSVISITDAEVDTKRSTNPKNSPGGITFTDKQTFTLSDKAGTCEISACSESQGSSLKDFSTNYCDLRNLYCGSADGCTPVVHDFSSTQESVTASSGQSDFTQCVVKGVTIV